MAINRKNEFSTLAYEFGRSFDQDDCSYNEVDFEKLWEFVVEAEILKEIDIANYKEEAYQQALLDLVAHFGEYNVPLTTTAKQVQQEIIKFMELNNASNFIPDKDIIELTLLSMVFLSVVVLLVWVIV